ncbi:Epimerase family protein [Planctomycetes bacterium Pan216]|uniref:Epimerase family protein n=1 Tax=Kolteria novifilia TaxID=2527975 RepID=A0A518B3A1_9BACT|nr:Epimerase family protein [Planctomycetes bacterium Pan216]
MGNHHFVRECRIEVSSEEVFRWHARPGAFERLNPPWEPVRVLSRTGSIHDGDELVIGIPAGPFTKRWLARHSDTIDGEQFRDTQISGPFHQWVHTHRFESIDDTSTLLKDDIDLTLPLSPVSDWIGWELFEKKLDRMFAYRHRITKGDLERHAALAPPTPLTFAVVDPDGIVGSALVPYLSTGGHRVLRVVPEHRLEEDPSDQLDVPRVRCDERSLADVDVLIDLTYAGPDDGATVFLCSVHGWKRRPPVIITASTGTDLGEHGDELLDDSDSSGKPTHDGNGARSLQEKGTRVVNLRMGMVLTPTDGVLKQLGRGFRGGAKGARDWRERWWSWIGLDDALDAILYAATNEELSGAVNVVAPEPTKGREFVETLCGLQWSAGLTPLSFVNRWRTCPGGRQLATSARLAPSRLTQAGFNYRTPTLEATLRHLLGCV